MGFSQMETQGKNIPKGRNGAKMEREGYVGSRGQAKVRSRVCRKDMCGQVWRM